MKKGTKLTPEHRAKIAATQKGRPKSATHRAAIAAGKTGQRHTVETRAKMRTAALRRWERERAANEMEQC